MTKVFLRNGMCDVFQKTACQNPDIAIYYKNQSERV